ncbi:MAG: hypothetical protein IT285_13315 [Bdellovibrionales bacterium]|nr:hypothetical protein [Bdellovibrionales bacterium]
MKPLLRSARIGLLAVLAATLLCGVSAPAAETEPSLSENDESRPVPIALRRGYAFAKSRFYLLRFAAELSLTSEAGAPDDTLGTLGSGMIQWRPGWRYQEIAEVWAALGAMPYRSEVYAAGLGFVALDLRGGVATRAWRGAWVGLHGGRQRWLLDAPNSVDDLWLGGVDIRVHANPKSKLQLWLVGGATKLFGERHYFCFRLGMEIAW